tara:strand:+ start:52 stop:258 length:207 start_codon:yes stop_codon:yes gene_type:complete
MKNLTTPKAILFGLGLIALAIASVPYSSQIIKPVFASSDKVHKIAICDLSGNRCAEASNGRFKIYRNK